MKDNLKSQCPKNLKVPGRVEWARVVDLCADMGTLNNLDYAALYTYCEAYQEFDELVSQVAETGPVTITDKGNYVQHPLLSVKNSAADRVLKIAKEFGFTPAARAKLGIGTQEEIDDFNAFVKRKIG